MRKIIALICVVVCWITGEEKVHAQSMNMHDVLASPVGGSAMEAQQRKLDYLDQHTFYLPFIDQLSVRFNSRMITNVPNSYQVSMRNNSIPMMHAQQESVKVMKALEQVEYDLMKQSDFVEKYQLLTDIYFRQQKIKHLEQLKNALTDEKNYFSKSIEINGDVSKLIHIVGLEDDILKAEGNINTFKEELNILKDRLSKLINKEIGDINTEAYIDADKAYLQAEQLSNESNETLILKKRKMEVQLNDWKRKMALREQFRLIDNFGFLYQDSIKKNDIFQQRVSFFLKINLPLPNTNKIKRQNAQLDVLEAEKKVEWEKRRLNVSIGMAKDQMKKDWIGYQTAASLAKKFQQDYNIEQLNKSSAPEPRLLFKVKSIQLQRNLNVEESREKFMKTYIKFLEEMGELGHKNYLSNQLEQL